MPVYKYKGYDLAGQKVEGEMSGATVEEVERKITAQAVTIIAIMPAGHRKRGSEGSAAATAAKPGSILAARSLTTTISPLSSATLPSWRRPAFPLLRLSKR